MKATERRETIFKQLKPDVILSDVCELSCLKGKLDFLFLPFYCVGVLFACLCTTRACLLLP